MINNNDLTESEPLEENYITRANSDITSTINKFNLNRSQTLQIPTSNIPGQGQKNTDPLSYYKNKIDNHRDKETPKWRNSQIAESLNKSLQKNDLLLSQRSLSNNNPFQNSQLYSARKNISSKGNSKIMNDVLNKMHQNSTGNQSKSNKSQSSSYKNVTQQNNSESAAKNKWIGFQTSKNYLKYKPLSRLLNDEGSEANLIKEKKEDKLNSKKYADKLNTSSRSIKLPNKSLIKNLNLKNDDSKSLASKTSTLGDKRDRFSAKEDYKARLERLKNFKRTGQSQWKGMQISLNSKMIIKHSENDQDDEKDREESIKINQERRRATHELQQIHGHKSMELTSKIIGDTVSRLTYGSQMLN